MSVFPIELYIGHVEHSLECASGEFQPKAAANHTFCTVAGGKILRLDRLSFTVSGSYACRYPGFVLREAFELRLPPNVFFVRFNILVKQSFMLSLFDDQHIRIRAEAL